MKKADPTALSENRAFGRHIKSLRRVRRLSQAELASRAGLASDTIRRMERGEFSPRLNTMWKVARGLDLDVSTMFVSFGITADADIRELLLLVTGRPRRVLGLVTELVRAVIAGLDDFDR